MKFKQAVFQTEEGSFLALVKPEENEDCTHCYYSDMTCPKISKYGKEQRICTTTKGRSSSFDHGIFKKIQ